MYNVRDLNLMLKSMSMHKNDNKGLVKFDFITSYLAFKNSIPIFTTQIEKKIKIKSQNRLQKYFLRKTNLANKETLLWLSNLFQI